MEAAGLALAVPRLALKLFKLYKEGYDLVGNIKVAGSDMIAKEKDLRVLQYRFDDWVTNLNALSSGGDLQELFGPDRYETIMSILVEFVQAFVKAGQMLENQSGRHKRTGSNGTASNDPKTTSKIQPKKIQHGIEVSIVSSAFVSPEMMLRVFANPKAELGRIPESTLSTSVSGVTDAARTTEIEVFKLQSALSTIQVTKYTVIGEKQLADLVRRLDRLLNQLDQVKPLRKALGKPLHS